MMSGFLRHMKAVASPPLSLVYNKRSLTKLVGSCRQLTLVEMKYSKHSGLGWIYIKQSGRGDTLNFLVGKKPYAKQEYTWEDIFEAPFHFCFGMLPYTVPKWPKIDCVNWLNLKIFTHPIRHSWTWPFPFDVYFWSFPSERWSTTGSAEIWGFGSQGYRQETPWPKHRVHRSRCGCETKMDRAISTKTGEIFLRFKRP